MSTNRIFVAGHTGMVGSAILNRLQADPANTVITRNRKELNLLDQKLVNDFFASEKIDQVYLAAAMVGGIYANNTFPAEFIYKNLMIEANIINASHVNDVQKLLFLGSSCIYPKYANQPMSESELLTGVLEKTNEPYAIAKIAGIKLCESYNRQYGRDYRSVMPTNLYGPNDNFNLENSHVIPAMIRKFHEAKMSNSKEVVVWGTGTPKREFLYVDDMADACLHVMNLDNNIYKAHINPMLSHINIGSGIDCSISELASLVSVVVGFDGEIKFDTTKPDGTPRKLLNVRLIEKLGWKSKISLLSGLRETYTWFLNNYNDVRS